jgi:hypothetical protein
MTRAEIIDETWMELSYVMRIRRGNAVVRALIRTLIEEGGANEAQRARLKSLLVEPPVVASTQCLNAAP